jgi:outer membrane protein OmpA-like peptidoglycan-associated protein
MKKRSSIFTADGRSGLALGLGLATALPACGGPALPPPALVSAREAYTVAQAGPATELAPAKLDTAKKALDAAEAQWKEDSDAQEPVTLTLAYVAERRARTAAAIGETEKAVHEKKALDEEYIELERKDASLTKAQLHQTKAELEKERQARLKAEKSLSAAVASLAEMASVKEEARGMVITLNGSVLFTTGKSELLQVAKNKLDEVAVALTDHGFKKIVIEGHTDSRGSAASNDELSYLRASAVKAHLVSQGLDASKIEAVGLGSSRPVASNKTPDGQANNRRVEIIVTN